MSGRVEGKVAVVTGSTRGIGESIAKRLAAEGAQVIVSGIDDDDGRRVALECREAGGVADYLHADVRRPEECAAAVAVAIERFGRLDILVNNAGIFPSLSLSETTHEMWDEVFSVNVRGAFLCSRAAIPEMQRLGGGVIINIGTTLAYRGETDRLAYAASKGALLTLTKTMARAYAKDRIRANWITVGWVASPGEIELRNGQHGNGLEYLADNGAKTPFGRIETADEIAGGVLYLASDESSHVTGCELNISGGLWI